MSGLVKIKDGGHLPEVNGILHISPLLYMIATKFQRLHPCVWDQATRVAYWKYCPISGHVGSQRWKPLTGSRYEIVSDI